MGRPSTSLDARPLGWFAHARACCTDGPRAPRRLSGHARYRVLRIADRGAVVKHAAILLVMCGAISAVVARSSAHTSQTAAASPSAGYPIRAVQSTSVQLTDGFWRPRLEI